MVRGETFEVKEPSLSQTGAPETFSENSTTTSFAIRMGWALLIVATLYICYFSHLGAIGFVGPDEPRYAWIARAMVESGDWVTPRLYGQPWFEKPVLYYWEAAVSFKLFGVSEAAARLPSAISALLATLALAWLALRAYGAETARWLLLLLPTTVGMIGFSHAAATDMPFSSMLTVAMVCAAAALGLVRNERSPVLPRTPWLALILFGFFLGLAVLAKGLAGVILCGGAVFFWALFTKRWRDALRLLHPVAIGIFCLTALPWYILCARRNPTFLHVFIVEHNFKRFLTPEFQHIQPFWYYIPIFLLATVPWIVPLAAWIRDVAKPWHANPLRTNPTSLYLVVWSLFTVLFFSASKSKLPGYILPAVPPFLLLLSTSIANRLAPQARKVRWVGIVCGVTLLCLAAAFVFWGGRLPFAVDYFPPDPLPFVLIGLGLAGIVVIIFGALRRTSLALASTVLALIVCIGWSLTGNARQSLDQAITAGFTGQEPANVKAHFGREAIFTYKLKRSFQYSLNFTFHEQLPEWKPGTQSYGWILTSPTRIPELSATTGVFCPAPIAYSAVIACKSVDLVPRSAGSGKLQ